MREIMVIAAAVTGAAVGFYVIGGGRGTPGEIIDNPEPHREHQRHALDDRWSRRAALAHQPVGSNTLGRNGTNEPDSSVFTSSKSPSIWGDSLGAAVHPILEGLTDQHGLRGCGIARRSAVDL
jgi:hypothetical protein